MVIMKDVEVMPAIWILAVGEEYKLTIVIAQAKLPQNCREIEPMHIQGKKQRRRSVMLRPLNKIYKSPGVIRGLTMRNCGRGFLHIF